MSVDINRIADLIAKETEATDKLSRQEQEELENAIRRLLMMFRGLNLLAHPLPLNIEVFLLANVARPSASHYTYAFFLHRQTPHQRTV